MICKGRPGNDDDDSSRTCEGNSRFWPIASLPHCPGAGAAEVAAVAAAGHLIPVWRKTVIKSELAF